MTQRRKCDVCRARKIKCDEASPACTQCRRGHRACSYKAARSDKHFFGHTNSGDLGLELKTSRYAPNGEGTYSTFRINEYAPGPAGECVASCDPVHLVQSPLNASVFRQQLTVLYLNDEYPLGSLSPLDREFVFNYHWFDPLGKTAQIAMDSIILFHLSRTISKESFLKDGHASYLRAICSLRRKLQGNYSAWDDDVLRATHLLTVAGQHRQLVPASHDLPAHVHGLELVLKARGPSSLQSNVVLVILLVSVVEMLLSAFQRRRGQFLGEPQWQVVLRPLFFETRFGLLTVCAPTLPALLFQADQLMSSATLHKDDASRLLESISEWKVQTEMWLSSWYAREKPCMPLRRQTGEQDGNGRTEESKVHQCLQDLTAEYPFEAFYQCDDLSDAIRHVWYWVMLLEAESAQLDIMALPVLRDTNFITRMTEAQERCDVLATNICEMTPCLRPTATVRSPYLCSTATVRSKNKTVCFGLSHAEKWYNRSGDSARAKWCRDIRQPIQVCALTLHDPGWIDGSESRDRGRSILNYGCMEATRSKPHVDDLAEERKGEGTNTESHIDRFKSLSSREI